MREGVAMNELELHDVGVRFGGVWALRHVDLVVERGERHVVLGPNGAGKSTLFNTILGEIKPVTGKVLLFGEDVTSRSTVHRVRRGLGKTFQQPETLSGLTVFDNVLASVRGRIGPRSSLSMTAARAARTRSLAEEALAKVGLRDVANAMGSELSHGQAKQLEIAMALSAGARLILLDEPASGLSAGERKRITSVIDDLEREVTVVVIEHDMEIAFHIADRLTVIHHGQVLASGDTEHIRSSEEVRTAYLGGGTW